MTLWALQVKNFRRFSFIDAIQTIYITRDYFDNKHLSSILHTETQP